MYIKSEEILKLKLIAIIFLKIELYFMQHKRKQLVLKKYTTTIGI